MLRTVGSRQLRRQVGMIVVALMAGLAVSLLLSPSTLVSVIDGMKEVSSKPISLYAGESHADAQRDRKDSVAALQNDWSVTHDPVEENESLFQPIPVSCDGCCADAAINLQRVAHKAKSFRPLPTFKKKVAYIKTHKTGSSTLGSILYRLGARHNLTLYKSPTHALRTNYYNNNTIPADIALHHYAGIVTRLKSFDQWEEAYTWYNKVVPNPAFVTVLRDPISHYVSYWYFYNEPKNPEKTLEEAVDRGMNPNILMHDFAVFTPEDLEKFMEKYADDFQFYGTANMMDESLVALAFKMGWSLIDMTYVKLLDSHSKEGMKRWDGRLVKPTPKLSSLPKELIAKIEKLTELDKLFYDYALAKLEADIAAVGPQFKGAVATFKELNAAISALCSCSDVGPDERAFCNWYALSDMKYEGRISKSGGAKTYDLPYFP